MRTLTYVYFLDREKMLLCPIHLGSEAAARSTFDVRLVMKTALEKGDDIELFDTIYKYYRVNFDTPYTSIDFVSARLRTSDFCGNGCRTIASGIEVGALAPVVKRIFDDVRDTCSVETGEVYNS